MKVICLEDVPNKEKYRGKFQEEGIDVVYRRATTTASTDGMMLIKNFIDLGKRYLESGESRVFLESHEKESALAAVALKRSHPTAGIAAIRWLHDPGLYCCKTSEILPSGEFCEGVGRSTIGYAKCLRCLSHFKKSELRLPLQYLTYKVTSKHVDLFVSFKEWWARGAIRNGYPRERLTVFPFWVDTQMFAPKKSQRTPQLEDKIVVLNPGAIVPPWKGLDVLVDAASFVTKRYPATVFVNLGGACRPHKDQDYIDGLHERIRRLGLADRFLFVPSVERSEVASWLNIADIVAFTSYYDNHNWSIVESMACEKPIVATDVGPTSEIMRDGVNGLLALNRNPRDIAEKIVRLIEDASLARRISRGARRTAEEREISNMPPRMERLYEDIG